jgi:hypothetical protein
MRGKNQGITIWHVNGYDERGRRQLYSTVRAARTHDSPISTKKKSLAILMTVNFVLYSRFMSMVLAHIPFQDQAFGASRPSKSDIPHQLRSCAKKFNFWRLSSTFDKLNQARFYTEPPPPP